MERNYLQDLEFEIEEINKTFVIGFTIKEVQELAGLSIAKDGQLTNKDFIGIALKAHTKGFINNRDIEKLITTIKDGVEIGDDYLTFEEIIEYTTRLSIEAIDKEAELHAPANVEILEDNTVKLIIEDKEYLLKFNRESITELVNAGQMNLNNPLELFTFGTTFVRGALQHYKRRIRVNEHENIFLSLWATRFEPETEDLLPEVINALVFHMGEVVDSGIKKSKAVIKATKR